MDMELTEMDGIILKHIFYNKQDGYTIALFKPDDLNGHVTIMAYHLPLPVKQLIRIKCKQVHRKKYFKLQYQVCEWEELEPPNPGYITEYLSSGIIKGLGVGIAQKIVAKFGIETLEIIQNDPDRLKEVPGIGPKLIEAIREGIPK
jgi:exodeoxyribonuclease V alpha subunit